MSWLVSLSHGQNAEERFYGKLTGLVADTKFPTQRILSSGPEKPKAVFSPSVGKGTSVFFGSLIDPRGSASLPVAILEMKDKPPRLGIDENRDGTIDANERYEFSPIGEGYFHSAARIPLRHPLFNAVPISIIYYRGLEHPSLKPTDRVISQSTFVYAFGNVSIGGKDVLFQYPFDPQSSTISTKQGLFGLDVNGDGEIYNEQFSIETSYASDEELVFRYGDKYLSTESIDIAKNEIVVRCRDKSEYLRAELEIGKEMLDFEFVDFEGKKRSLKEFRGKYLLVEFWGVWCIDCVRDMPFNVQAYERFRSRGFDILGLNWDDSVEEARSFLTKSKAPWTQARKDSIRSLTEKIYRIQEYPSTILLGPDGKVLILDQKSIQGAPLLDTLERILSKPQ